MVTRMHNRLLVACADVGSVASGNFGWWACDGRFGQEPSTLAHTVATALDDGVPVALGFECPLFVPLRDDETCLTRARPGEGSRAWSAGAGCGALATGIVQVAWVLRAVREALRSPCAAFLDWHAFSAAGSGLLLWEAFVSGSGKGVDHLADAKRGATALLRALPTPLLATAVHPDGPVYSLAGAALLRTGWTESVALLAEPCLVIKAAQNAA
jgi:hypothetical protein